MPGSGLGLSIVRQVVERHAGSVQAGENVGGGARLVLEPPERRRWMPRSYAAGAAALAVLLLAGCGDDDLGEKPDLPDETPALWNPCDVLDAAFIEKTFGTVAAGGGR